MGEKEDEEKAFQWSADGESDFPLAASMWEYLFIYSRVAKNQGGSLMK